jgi:hypothetical protein
MLAMEWRLKFWLFLRLTVRNTLRVVMVGDDEMRVSSL